MTKRYVSVVFDRKKNALKKGVGKIELRICLTQTCRKYFVIGECTPMQWEVQKNSKAIEAEKQKYEKIASAMVCLGEEMTLENLNRHLGIDTATKKEKKSKEDQLQESFLDFMRDEIIKERIKESTRKQKLVAYDALEHWGKIKTFADLTPAKLKAWDTWLRADGTRSDPAVYNYHKRLKPYVRTAYEKGIIDKDPYSMCHFPRGKSKERRPLTEQELKQLREAELPEKESRVRDLFIFAAYTGLAFCDVMEFNFETMAEQRGDMYFIDGSRLKTGTNFFTPILPPAMDVLIRYDFKLPKISNQKANDYLHLIESRLGINKSMTFHVARHCISSFSLKTNDLQN